MLINAVGQIVIADDGVIDSNDEAALWKKRWVA